MKASDTVIFTNSKKVGNSPYRYGSVHYGGKQVGTFEFPNMRGKYSIGIYPHFFMTRDTEEQAREDIACWLKENKVTCDCYLGTSGIQI